MQNQFMRGKKKIGQWLPLFIEGRNCLRRDRMEVSVFILW